MGKRSRPLFYRLKGHTVLPLAGDRGRALYEFTTQLHQDRRVAVTKGIGWSLSTVFLGIDHNHMAIARDLPPSEAPPLIFETMFFDHRQREPEASVLERYSTWNQAEIGHGLHLSKILVKNRTVPTNEIDTPNQ